MCAAVLRRSRSHPVRAPRTNFQVDAEAKAWRATALPCRRRWRGARGGQHSGQRGRRGSGKGRLAGRGRVWAVAGLLGAGHASRPIRKLGDTGAPPDKHVARAPAVDVAPAMGDKGTAEAGQLVQLDDLFTGIWLVDKEERGGEAIRAEMAAGVEQPARLSAMRQSVLGSLPELPAQSDIPGSPGGQHLVWIMHAPIGRSGHVPMSDHAATPRLCCDLVQLGSMCVIV